MGPKYVPHPHPPHFVPRLKVIRHECEGLARTLGWSAFFEKKKREGLHTRHLSLLFRCPYKNSSMCESMLVFLATHS